MYIGRKILKELLFHKNSNITSLTDTLVLILMDNKVSSILFLGKIYSCIHFSFDLGEERIKWFLFLGKYLAEL